MSKIFSKTYSARKRRLEFLIQASHKQLNKLNAEEVKEEKESVFLHPVVVDTPEEKKRKESLKDAPIVVELQHICKYFPGIRANDDISLSLRKGEIHALLGENGAGKSTLMSILFGLNNPDSGKIIVKGKEVKNMNPNEATRLGIGMVHQHFKLVEIYTALQNIILGQEPTKFGFLKPKAVKKSIEELCKKYKFHVDINQKIEDMPVGEQQKVEILKMLYRNNDILIFDEPTAVLTPQEIQDLIKSIKTLAEEGKSILFISHKLNEIMEVSDRVSILSRGKYLGTYETKDTTPEMLSRLMVGRDVQLVANKTPSHPGKDVLTVKDLHVINPERKKEVVHGVSFNVRAGEIVCIAGIEGNGQSDLVYALTGLEKVKSGEIVLHDVDRYQYEYPGYKDGYRPSKFRIALNTLAWYPRYYCAEAWSFTKAIFTHKKRIKLPSPRQFNKMPRYVDAHLERLSVRERSKYGVAHIPEDRQKYGLILDFSLKDNLVLEKYFEPRFQCLGFIKEKEKAKYANALIQKYDIRSGKGASSIVRGMSGGNQQKAILARELDRGTPLLIAVQPTRGLDVGAIENIHKEIISHRDQGKGVLLVSLELEEVLNVSDRILVMYNGEIVAELDPKKTSANEIGLYMSGAKRMDLSNHEDMKEVESFHSNKEVM